MKKWIALFCFTTLSIDNASAQYDAAIGAAASIMQAAAAQQAAEAAREAAAARASEAASRAAEARARAPRVVYRPSAPKVVYRTVNHTKTVYRSEHASSSNGAPVVRASGKDPFSSGGSDRFQ